MTMITVSRSEIEAMFNRYRASNKDNGWCGVLIADLRALLDKAEVVSGEAVAQVAQEGFGRGQVYWHKKCPPDGTDLYPTPQPSRIAELEAEIARLTAIIEDMKVVDNVFSK